MDTLLRALNEPETMRIVAATTTASVREACRRQGVTGVAAVALGRALTAGVLLATLAKGEKERVRIHLQGDGPLGALIVDAHGDGSVRACFDSERTPDAPLASGDHARISTAQALGTAGHLVITRDLGFGHPYQGSVELSSGEVDEDIEHYLDHSEQLPTILRTEEVLDRQGHVLRSAGILVQGFPGADSDLLDLPRARLEPGNLRSLLLAHERTTRELVGLALGGAPFRAMLEHSIQFRCTCGPARAQAVLATLGASDLEKLALERPQTEVKCSFCGDITVVSADQLRELAGRLREAHS